MSLRSLKQVDTDIENITVILKQLKMEKKIIKFAEKYEILKSELEKITDLTINTLHDYNSEGEYSHYQELELEIKFKRHFAERKFKIKYVDYSPDDDGDRYGTSHRCNIECSFEEDPILKDIYKTLKDLVDDGDWDEIRYFIKCFHD